MHFEVKFTVFLKICIHKFESERVIPDGLVSTL
jgi:hypothetical protein